MSDQKPFIGEVTFHVRYAETDAMGIVHHGSYIIYFEEGRSNYIRQRGSSYAEFERTGYYLTVSEVNVRYLRPARYDQRLTVRCRVSEAKSRQITFSYEVVDAENGDVFATGSSKHICITQDGQVARIPDLWRAWVG